MGARSGLLITVLLVCAIGSWVLLRRTAPEPRQAESVPALGLGYYARAARLSSSDEDGRFLYQVSAESVEQTRGGSGIDLHRVTVDYDPAAHVAWNLHADAGRIPPGGKIVQLSGNVVAETRATDPPVTTIRTDYLEFDTRTDVVATDRAVTIDSAGNAVRATGLRASLVEDRVELLSGVTGTYVRR